MAFNCFNGTYRLQRKIGSGSFGDVYLARDILTVQDVVIKLEPAKAKHNSLEREYHVYQMLSGEIGILRAHWFGTEDGFNAMALDCLGLSLEDLFARCHSKFTLKTVLLLADQLLCRLKYIHSHNVIHRDIKPSNIVMGLGAQSMVVYLIDFGLSKEYRDPYNYKHIPCKRNLGLTGTATFASINSHMGSELGRRDDLESLAYILIYFLRGHLPWQGLSRGSKDIVKRKQRTSNLCRGLPSEFSTFLQYSRSLSFEAKPDYEYIGNLFSNLLSREVSQNAVAFDFDWDDDDNERVFNGSGGYCEVGRRKRKQPRERLRSQTRQRERPASDITSST